MKRLLNKTLILTLAIVLACCCLLACNGSAEIEGNSSDNISEVSYVTPEEPITGSNWMSHIDGDKPLSEITIPGTHDTGAYNAVGINIFGQTQDLSIKKQLEAGARAFDIRLVLTNKELRVYHGFLDVNLTFAEVLEAVDEFLTENPKETVVMSVQQEDYEDYEEFATAAKDAILGCPRFFTEDRIPTLSEVRGKIVLLRRYDADYALGIDCNTRWSGTSYNESFTKHIQDHYSISSYYTLDDKWNDIISLYDSPEAKFGDLFINFASCVVYAEVGSYEIPEIKQASDTINARILSELPTLNRTFFGIFMMDFISEELASLLYNMNF